MPRRIDDPAEAPAMFISDRTNQRRATRDGFGAYRGGIIDDQPASAPSSRPASAG